MSNFISTNRKGKKALPSFVTQTESPSLPTSGILFFFPLVYNGKACIDPEIRRGSLRENGSSKTVSGGDKFPAILNMNAEYFVGI